MATPGFRDRARNRSPTRPFSTTVALADLSEEESIPSTASIGVRRSASRGHLRPRLDANGRAIVVESETIRKVFGGEASDEEMAPSSSRQMPQSRNLRGLGIDTANAAARASTIFAPPSPTKSAYGMRSPSPGNALSRSPSKLSRTKSPAPSTNTLSGLRKPLSRIFGRKKSRASLQPDSAASSSLPLTRVPSPSKSHGSSPFPASSRQGSPEMRYRSVFEDEESVAQNRLSRISCLPSDSGAEKKLPSAPDEPKKIKKKSSFSAFSALFRPRSQSTAIRPPSPVKRPSSPVKKAYKRTFTPEPLPLPITPDFARSPSTLGQLFDLAQADAEAVLADAADTPALTFYSPAMASSRLSLAVPEPAGRTLTKSRSTPDLYAHARQNSIAASTKPNAQHAYLPRLAAPSVPSSPIIISRLPSPVPTPSSGRFPVSPNPSVTAFTRDAFPGPYQPLSLGRTRSPTPPTKAASTTSSQPSFYKNVQSALLDGVVEQDEEATSTVANIRGASSVPFVAQPTPPPPEKASRIPLASLVVKSQVRPTTAGTFGRPGTANRPDTAATFDRPDTGVDSLRPDTAISIGDLARATRISLAPKPRFRRISGLAANFSDDDEEKEREEGSLSHTETSRSDEPIPHFPADEDGSLKAVDRERKLSVGMARDDSGFTELSGPLTASRKTVQRFPSYVTLSAVADVSAAGSSQSPARPPRIPPKSSLRPTTANTIAFPSPDEDEIEAAFNPKNSLGSIARQSTMSILSDFERSWDGKLAASEEVDSEAEHLRGRLQSSVSLTEWTVRKRDPLFGSIVQKRISQIPVAVDTSLDLDTTPTRAALAVAMQETPDGSPIISKRFGSAEEGRKILDRESSSSSLLKRLEARKQTEGSLFLARALIGQEEGQARGVSSPGSEQAIASTSASPNASSDARLNSPHDPFAGSYFPPVQTMGIASNPDAPTQARHKRSQSFFAKLDQAASNREADRDKKIEELQEKLEDAMRKIELLEYALAAH